MWRADDKLLGSIVKQARRSLGIPLVVGSTSCGNVRSVNCRRWDGALQPDAAEVLPHSSLPINIACDITRSNTVNV